MVKSLTPLLKHLNDFLDYCDVVNGLSSKTIENYHRFLKRFINWLEASDLQKIKPHELTSDLVYKYRLYLSRQISKKNGHSLKKNTQNYYLIALRALLTYFAKKDIITLPADKITLAKEKSVNKVKFLNLEQIEKLLLSPNIDNIIGLRDRAILETFFSTGLRVGELVKLNREQINFDYIREKKPQELEIAITGKGGYIRTVYFSKRSLKWVIRYLEKRHDVENPLFINCKKGDQPGKRLTTRSMERIIKKYVIKSGLPIDTTPHTIRHSYATDLLEQGVDLRTIQDFLGHKNIITTQIYTHVTNKHLRDVHRAFHSGKRLRE